MSALRIHFTGDKVGGFSPRYGLNAVECEGKKIKESQESRN